MHIDFAPSSNGTYNNTGSSRQLVNYLEHEDLERMEKGIYTEGFFNLTDDNIYKSKVIKDIDSNIGQLLKTDAKFYAIHVSPSEKELQAMGSTEQEQAEAMKRYIREVFIPEYAKNFNKELTASDIKFYGKIHFDRNRSDNELNMHCHLIVSRKDQSNKKKLSPLTNHKNTKNGVIKGGFDRVNLFQQVEQGFDKLFSYNRQLSESFSYYNTMNNRAISGQIKLQKQENQYNERKIETTLDDNQKKMFYINIEIKEANNQVFNMKNHFATKSQEDTSIKPSSFHKGDDPTSNLFKSLVVSETELQPSLENEIQKLKKQKKHKRRKL